MFERLENRDLLTSVAVSLSVSVDGGEPIECVAEFDPAHDVGARSVEQSDGTCGNVRWNPTMLAHYVDVGGAEVLVDSWNHRWLDGQYDDGNRFGYDWRGVKVDGERFVAGDLDKDGDVDFTDFLHLSANFGGSGRADAVWAQGDFDFDGEVGFVDFLHLSANFGGVK